ncbi:hypothetical protein CW298_1564 [Salmonella enterica subsp. enterica serovar Muenchen]|uniref:Uncharacterized protein n=2 Tax=Salmonella enterica I TaxID=59201 RepID=C0Q7I5_SALPC|nr:hypothetical protein SPC_4664 [Salmonella enterica subsp. enterica serovar Paratyphi C str. RKS4594]EHC62961.1 hypothetical protein LTSEMIN_4510 [Salmonella enterica subsp. enterica serovar Minnesota str. A4-603]EHC96514.1 hypothetical protein LTSEURB_6552 [Salmonella enterica subsp. enterica serovar Urbana str. R8-2977]PQB18085.1 hypothetical protein CW298_1564 [Salmonella enterica subsp. enterica serovar Muenchen]
MILYLVMRIKRLFSRFIGFWGRLIYGGVSIIRRKGFE